MVLDVIHDIQIAEKSVAQLLVKVPHLICCAKDFLYIHAWLNFMNDFLQGFLLEMCLSPLCKLDPFDEIIHGCFP